MEEKKKIKVSLSAIVIFILIVIIIGMGFYIYKLNKDKYYMTVGASQQIEELNDKIDKLEEKSQIQSKVDESQEKLNGDINSVKDNTSELNTNFFGLFKSSDGIYKYVFLPNGEMCFINEKSALNFKTFVGTYYIDNGTLYYSLNAFTNWFELRQPSGGGVSNYFKIVDNNTLEQGREEYNNLQHYIRNESLISGTYWSDDGSINLNNNKFEITSYGSETLTGTYTINNNILYLNPTNDIEKWYILDNDIIILEIQVNGRTSYTAYLK